MSDNGSLRFSESHEWFRLDGDVITIGLSKFAADELTDITYVEMQPVGTDIAAGDAIGEVESVKTTSDIYSAVAGEIVEVNAAVEEDPSLINTDSFGNGWLVKIKAEDTAPLDDLMDESTYHEKHPTD